MKPQKGLGRGLDAIFNVDKPQPEVRIKPMSDIAEIDLNLIEANHLQPRREFDAEALEGLADSIRSLGVIQPITVRPSGSKYTIISGERRWRAAKSAGLNAIPAYVRDVDDNKLNTMALVENIQRQDLNPIEIAISIARLIEECNLTQEALAERVGIKRPTISNYLRLLNLPDTVQFALKSGVITMGHAKVIAGVEPSKQLSFMKRCIDKQLSVRQAEEIARAMLSQKEPKATTQSTAQYPESYSRLTKRLESYFTDKISIKPTKSGGGKITIEFNDDSEIETFIARLESQKSN